MDYAIVKEGVCVNVIVSEAAFAEQIGAVPLAEGYGIGDLFDGSKWTKAAMPELEPEVIEPTLEERLAAAEQALLALMED